ncbi:hypothetical protein V1506DRAFT_528340 [Lipomyces tetrasporus]
MDQFRRFTNDCKARSYGRNTRNLPAVVGTRGVMSRSILSHCPWRVRFKKQLDDLWVITELIG